MASKKIFTALQWSKIVNSKFTTIWSRVSSGISSILYMSIPTHTVFDTILSRNEQRIRSKGMSTNYIYNRKSIDMMADMFIICIFFIVVHIVVLSLWLMIWAVNNMPSTSMFGISYTRNIYSEPKIYNIYVRYIQFR